MELNSPKPTANTFGGVAFGARAQREPSPRSRPSGLGPSPGSRGRLFSHPLARSACPPLNCPARRERHAKTNTAALRQARCARWSVWPRTTCRAPHGALGARHSPQIDLSRFLPSFFAFAFRVNVIRCGGFASGFRGINRVCRHPVVTSFPRVPQPLFIPRPHRFVSSLRSPLRFAKPPNRIPLFTRQTRKNWEEKVNGIDRFGAVLNKDGTAPNREAC